MRSPVNSQQRSLLRKRGQLVIEVAPPLISRTGFEVFEHPHLAPGFDKTAHFGFGRLAGREQLRLQLADSHLRSAAESGPGIEAQASGACRHQCGGA